MKVNTKYDWINVHEDIKYIATDACGSIFGYRKMPFIKEYRGEWCSYNGSKLLDFLQKNYEFDWRDSLEARPEISND